MLNVAPGIPRTALPHDVLRAALEALDRGRRAVLASVLARHGSAPSTPGQKLALFEDGSAIGTIGGGAVERVVLGSMAKALSDAHAAPRVETFRLGASLGMCCGGSVDILIEPLVPPTLALVVGAGHVGVFVAPLLASLGFRVTLCDAREEAADPARLAQRTLLVGASRDADASAGEDAEADAEADAEGAVSGGLSAELGALAGVKILHAEYDDPEVIRAIARPEEAIALVMTHDHALDQRAIEWAIERGFGFVGGVGSRAKAARTRGRLEAKGVGAEDIARVRMPVGADIGARTPAEIGISIAAELVAWRAGRQRARWQAAEGTASASPSASVPVPAPSPVSASAPSPVSASLEADA